MSSVPESLRDAYYLAEWQSTLGSTLVNSYTLPGLGDSWLAQEAAGINLPIKQMWGYAIDKDSKIVRIDNVMENVNITGVLINGVEAEDRGNGLYAAAHAQQEGSEEELTVSVNYTINGIVKQTVYSPAFNGCLSTTEFSTKVTSIVLNPETWSGTEGDAFKIAATVLPENATDKSLVWSTSDEAVATVDAEGNVTILAPGVTVITATAADGSGVTATCQITSGSGLKDLIGDGELFDVYNVNGLLLKKGCDVEHLKQFAPGFYIILQGNMIKKIVLR